MGIKEKVGALPHAPGVYIMKDASGAVLYVGKADDLKKRVSGYFRRRGPHSPRIASMVRRVSDIETVPALSGAEALIYENGLIKQLSPKYNVALRDDKSYPMLKLTVNEEFPRLEITREKKSDGAIYYGPYTSAKLLRSALKILQKLFPLRTCGTMPRKECLQFHIKQCKAPCIGGIGTGEYSDMVSGLKLFLEGRRAELLKMLSEKMKQLSAGQKFEEALEIRNRLEALGAVASGRIRYRPFDELAELKRLLSLKTLPDRIEAFDVSNIMGQNPCGSMVYFYKGRPDKDNYRRFKIKTVTGMDDYSMMREIVRRRYRRLVGERSRLPDLVIIDGGKGHLSVAVDELRKLGVDHIPAIGIAKPARPRPSRSGGRGERGEFERIYTRNKSGPVTLPKESRALHLIERIRDEAHRFAISYHKKLRSKRMIS
jgi:excinuclease ABC subunit C